MADLRVEVVAVSKVENCPNADRLDLITVLGWQCVATKGKFKDGDLAVYFPIDSILPDDIEKVIFPPGSKIKLHKSRVKTEKIRGAISQGLAILPEEVGQYNVKLGDDLTETLGVTKFEPPEAPSNMQGQQVSWRKKNPFFREYTDLNNGKHYPDLFTPGETVSVTEKIHGTNFRAGWVPNHVDSWIKRFAQILHILPKWEFVYGSRRVQLQDKNRVGGSGWYEKGSNSDHGRPIGNVYEEAVIDYCLRRRIPKGYVVYGEIYGDGIQKGYTYGTRPGQRSLVLFDVMNSETGEYLSPAMLQVFGEADMLPVVPEIFNGPFDFDAIKELTKGNSVLAPAQKVREGVVVKPIQERSSHAGRAVLKFISDQYLLSDQTDFH